MNEPDAYESSQPCKADKTVINLLYQIQIQNILFVVDSWRSKQYNTK